MARISRMCCAKYSLKFAGRFLKKIRTIKRNWAKDSPQCSPSPVLKVSREMRRGSGKGNGITRRHIMRIVTNLMIILLSLEYCSTRSTILTRLACYLSIRGWEVESRNGRTVQLNSCRGKIPGCKVSQRDIQALVYFASAACYYVHHRSETCLPVATSIGLAPRCLRDVSIADGASLAKPAHWRTISKNALVVGGSGLSTGASLQFSARTGKNGQARFPPENYLEYRRA